MNTNTNFEIAYTDINFNLLANYLFEEAYPQTDKNSFYWYKLKSVSLPKLERLLKFKIHMHQLKDYWNCCITDNWEGFYDDQVYNKIIEGRYKLLADYLFHECYGITTYNIHKWSKVRAKALPRISIYVKNLSKTYPHTIDKYWNYFKTDDFRGFSDTVVCDIVTDVINKLR